jgi:hypothetical protein
MCFSTSSCARPSQIVENSVIEESEVVLVLTTNGALGIPRGLVSTSGLVTVEDILESTTVTATALRQLGAP